MSGLARAREGGHLYLPLLYLKENLSNFKGERVWRANPLKAIGLKDFKSRSRGNGNSIQQISVINSFLEAKIFSSLFLAVTEQQGQAALQRRGAGSLGQCRAGRAGPSLTTAPKQVEQMGLDESPVSTQQVLSSRAGLSQDREPSPQVQIREVWDWMQTYPWWRCGVTLLRTKHKSFKLKRSPQNWGDHLQTLRLDLPFKTTGCPLSSHLEPRQPNPWDGPHINSPNLNDCPASMVLPWISRDVWGSPVSLLPKLGGKPRHYGWGASWKGGRWW